jgi:ATP-binding cassette subfamily F protein 3
VLEVEGGTVTSHEGNYEDYLRRKEALAGGASQIDSLPKGALGDGLRQGTTSVVPKNGQNERALAPEDATEANTGGAEPNAAANDRPRRLNPIKQKQMEERCAFLEEETPRIEAAIAHTEEQLGVYVSAAETQRLTDLAEDLRSQLASLTAEWEELMMQLEGA